MIGERLGKWVIYKELGRGGMGRVYLAQEEIGGRQAALKVLAAELAQETGFLQRFQREIDTLSQLDHPNVVRFYESGLENGLYFYAMEYVDGQSLEEVLLKNRHLPWRDVLDMALQICPALKHVHDHGIIHRDLKPANILRTSGGLVKLSDFGIAKVFAQGHLTATGGVLGTAEFISPEQAAGKPITKRSDLYSLGVVLYTLLTGRPPFTGESFVDLLHKHRYAQFDPPRNVVDDLPYEIDDVICLLLEKDPGRRPPDCLVLSRQLESVRRKLDRKGNPTQALGRDGGTVADDTAVLPSINDRAGPATLMSQLMREELARQNRGGPLTQFFNRWYVLLPLLLLVLGILVWTFWPVEEAQSRVADEVLPAGESEGQRLYRMGEKLQEQGDPAAARRLWTNLVVVFKNVDSEQQWVQRARQAVADLDSKQADSQRFAPVRAALQHAQTLAQQGNRDAAEAIWRGIEELYANDKAAADLLLEIKRARDK